MSGRRRRRPAAYRNRDEARLPAHELDDANALVGAAGLHLLHLQGSSNAERVDKRANEGAAEAGPTPLEALPAPTLQELRCGAAPRATRAACVLSAAHTARAPLSRPLLLLLLPALQFPLEYRPTLAARIAFCASSTAVSNPNVLSICAGGAQAGRVNWPGSGVPRQGVAQRATQLVAKAWCGTLQPVGLAPATNRGGARRGVCLTSSRSLSMLLGTATTQHGTCLESHSRVMASAAALPPRPPTMNRMSIFQRSAGRVGSGAGEDGTHGQLFVTHGGCGAARRATPQPLRRPAMHSQRLAPALPCSPEAPATRLAA